MQNTSATAPALNSQTNAPAPLVLDIRPMFAAGISPCSIIDETVARLQPQQRFVLLAPFEPVPLFTKLSAHGLSHRSEPEPDGSWRIVFEPTGSEAAAAGSAHQSCCCED